MKAWDERCARMLNIEFEWPSNEIPEVPQTAPHRPTHPRPTLAPTPPNVAVTLILKVLSKMRCDKAAGPPSTIAEMLKAVGVVRKGLDWQDSLQWRLSVALWSHETGMRASFWVSIKQGEAHGKSRGLKFTDLAMKLPEQVLNSYIHEMVNIDEMQFSLCL